MRRIFTLIFIFSISVFLFAQPTIDGDLSDTEYTSIATKQNSNSGFGTDIDVTEIVYYSDVTNSNLYLGIKGKLNTGSTDGIGVWINIAGSSSPTGVSSGTELGFDGAGHYMDGEGGGTNDNFKSDFEVDYMFAFNPGGGSASVFWDASSLIGGNTAEYQGSCDQSGTATTNSSAGGGIFTQNSITFAFNNGGGADQGLEMEIPFSEINATSSMNIEVFAVIVSATGFFSNVTVPGNVTTGNPGSNADFSTLSGGPYNSGNEPLPVELTSFTTNVNEGSVTLNWNTATEIDNYGFEIERKQQAPPNLPEGEASRIWNKVGFVNGAGNSNSPKSYTFTDNNLDLGKYSYRLKQIDNDGSFEYSKVVEVEVGAMPEGYVLEQNYPNPFNPSTTIKFGFEENTQASLVIYDVLGNKVAELFNETADAGRIYNVEFNASNLSSGIYYYKLSSDKFTEVKKMLLMK